MKLPNAEHAVVSETKVVTYLLDAGHPDNGGKAAFFTRFGFKAEAPESFIQAMQQHAQNTAVALASPGYDGATLYALDGPMDTPLARTPKVRSIWVIERNQSFPRFVTAYPTK